MHAVVHVTGGGLVENVPRVLPEGLGAEIVESSWPVPPIFGLLAEASGASIEDLRSTFNLGLGMVLVVSADDANAVLERCAATGTPAFAIGRVVQGSGARFVGTPED